MKERIIELLLALGNTSQEIREKILSLNIKGNRLSACRCPIANYLKNELQAENVWYDGMSVRVDREKDFCDWEKEIYLYENTPYDIAKRLDAGVKTFVQNFDMGDYPELVAQWLS